MDFRNSAKNYFDLKASGSRVDFQLFQVKSRWVRNGFLKLCKRLFQLKSSWVRNGFPKCEKLPSCSSCLTCPLQNLTCAPAKCAHPLLALTHHHCHHYQYYHHHHHCLHRHSFHNFSTWQVDPYVISKSYSMFDLNQSNTSGKCIVSKLCRCFACAQGWQKLWGCQYLATVPPFPLIFAQHALAPPPALATYMYAMLSQICQTGYFLFSCTIPLFLVRSKGKKKVHLWHC